MDHFMWKIILPASALLFLGCGAEHHDEVSEATQIDGELPQGFQLRDTSAPEDSSRDPFSWPFAWNSIWNTPIGSNAVYVKTDLGPMEKVHDDREYLVLENPRDKLKKIYLPNSNTVSYRSARIPDGFENIVEQWRSGFTPNNIAGFVQPNGSIVNIQPLRFFSYKGGSKRWHGYNTENTHLYDDGIVGAHFGSKLSSLGGSIRKGELTNDKPIRHALQLELDFRHLYRDPSDPKNRYQTFRWPALISDMASKPSPNYTGKNPALRMGSLMAIKPSITAKSLGLKTKPAKKILEALRNYGAYIVDTSGGNWKNIFQLAVDYKAVDEFRSVYGHNFSVNLGASKGKDWFNDIEKIWNNLVVVDNNSKNNVGGGGTPRVSKAIPPLRYEAEHLKRKVQGASAKISVEDKASYKSVVIFEANGKDDAISFTLPNVRKGTYNLVIRAKMANSRGTYVASIDGTQLGSSKSFYSTSTKYQYFRFGKKTFSKTGNKVVQLKVTGKSSKSKGYKLGIDQIFFELVASAPATAKLIKNRATGHHMRPKNCSKTSNESVSIVQVPNSYTGNCTRWKMKSTSDGYFHLINLETNHFVRPNGCSGKTDESVTLKQVPSSYTGSCTQWKKVTTSDGYFRLQNRATKAFLRPKSCDSGTDESVAIAQVPNTFTGTCTEWKGL